MSLGYRNTVIASVGSGLEYYDFLIYGLSGVYLSSIFFSGDSFSNLLSHFSMFSVGYFFIPVGSFFWGLYSDKYGRAKSFGKLMLLMSVATFIIGFLPTSLSVINISLVILVLMRIMQGVAFGGELPSALTLIYESSGRSAIHSGFVSASCAAGNVVALIVLYLISKFLREEQIMDFGWRIPFVFGGVISFVIYLLRKDILETPEYLKTQNDNIQFFEPMKHIIRFAKLRLVAGVLLSLGARMMIVFFIYLPVYLKQGLSYKADFIFLMMGFALVISMIASPFLGKLTQLVGKNRILICNALFFAFLIPIFFSHIQQLSNYSLLVFVTLYQICLTGIYVSSITLIPGLFSVRCRTTGLALCYGISYFISGMVPAFLVFLVGRNYENAIAFNYFFAGVGFLIMVSILILYFSKEADNDR